MTEPRRIVVTYRRGQRFVWLAVFLISVSVTFFTGRFWEARKGSETLMELSRLKERIEVIENELVLREEQLRNVLLSSEVDEVALENTRQQMVIMQRQIRARDEDLRLYRDLLQDNDSPAGLSASDFQLSLLQDRRIKYRWVARQKSSEMRLLSVYVDFSVHGKINGQNVIIGLSELDGKIEKTPYKIEFKYFSIQQGIMELPDNFEPYIVRISLRYTWEERVAVTRDFNWEQEV